MDSVGIKCVTNRHSNRAPNMTHVWLHCALSLAAQCIVIGPVCLCVGLFVFAGLLLRQLEIACIDLHQTGSVTEGNDHLQLIKFWRSCAPGKVVCGWAKFFGSALILQPACSVCVCVSLSAFFIHVLLLPPFTVHCVAWPKRNRSIEICCRTLAKTSPSLNGF